MVNAMVILKNWQHPLERVDFLLLIAEVPVRDCHVEQGVCHMQVIHAIKLPFYLQGALENVLLLALVHKVPVSVPTWPTSV